MLQEATAVMSGPRGTLLFPTAPLPEPTAGPRAGEQERPPFPGPRKARGCGWAGAVDGLPGFLPPLGWVPQEQRTGAETGSLGDSGQAPLLADVPEAPWKSSSFYRAGPASSPLSDPSVSPAPGCPRAFAWCFLSVRYSSASAFAAPPSGHPWTQIRLGPHDMRTHPSSEPWDRSLDRHLRHLESYQLAGSTGARGMAVPPSSVLLSLGWPWPETLSNGGRAQSPRPGVRLSPSTEARAPPTWPVPLPPGGRLAARYCLGSRPPGVTLLGSQSIAWGQLLSRSQTQRPCHLQGRLRSGVQWSEVQGRGGDVDRAPPAAESGDPGAPGVPPGVCVGLSPIPTARSRPQRNSLSRDGAKRAVPGHTEEAGETRRAAEMLARATVEPGLAEGPASRGRAYGPGLECNSALQMWEERFREGE